LKLGKPNLQRATLLGVLGLGCPLRFDNAQDVPERIHE
jgi:hypothetical protein